MNELVLFLIQYSYILIFAWVFVDQMGVPLPVVPLLLAAGALSGAGQLSFFPVLSLAVVASFLSNAAWYEMGRRRGSAVLNMLCRIALEPESCVRRTENMFSRHGNHSLLVARFVPGFSAVASPVAGIFKMPRLRFLLLNGAGAVLWAGTFIGLGFFFSSQLEKVSKLALSLGSWLAVLVAVFLIVYLGIKYLQRRRFLRQLRMARITPEELKQKLDAGDEVVIVDLRHDLDFERTPQTLPGALRLAPEELAQRHREIPRDREIVLYCT